MEMQPWSLLNIFPALKDEEDVNSYEPEEDEYDEDEDWEPEL